MKYLIPHIPHSSRNSNSDSSYSSWGIAIPRGSPKGLFPSEGVNSEDISMFSNNLSMNLDNNDEADSNELRNLIAQQTNIVSRT